MKTAAPRAIDLPAVEWQALQDVVAEFERGLRAGSSPGIPKLISEHPDLQPVLLPELVHAELEFRLRAGEGVKLKDYYDRYPELDGDSAAELAATDFRLRRELDPNFDAKQYRADHPNYVLTIDSIIEANGSASTTVTNDSSVSRSLPTVSGYQVRREIGRGGMGVVYEGWDSRLNRTVALKMLRHDESPAALERLRREAATLAAFQHPNIVPIFEVGEAGGRTYLAVEYLTGGTLKETIAAAPLDATSAAKLVRTLARAVQAAHERGVIHRDIKPGNILLAADGTPKLNDFGLAKPMDEPGGPTETGALLGTPGYMAPEQTRGEVTASVDIYSLGVVLYECLAARPPFRGATPLDTLAQTRDREQVPLRQLQPGVPRDLETICAKCLRKDPASRYDSACALADDLERFLDRQPIRARPVGALERSWKWARRHPAWSLLALLLLTAGTAFAVQWARFSRDLRNERDVATAQFNRAEASFQAARQSLAEFRKLRDDPRLDGDNEPLRMELLRAEAEFYRRFTQIQSDNPTFRDEQSLAAYELARIVHDLGDVPAGLEATNAAIALHREQVERLPDREDATARLVYLRAILATQLNVSRQQAEAEQVILDNLTLAESAVARWPANPAHSHTLAGLHHSLGLQYRQRGDNDGAAVRHREAIRIMDQLLANSINGVYLGDRVRFAISLATAESNAKRRGAAKAVLQEALVFGDKAPTEAAATPVARAMLAEAQMQLAQLHWDERNAKEAEPLYNQAVATLRELHKKNPNRGSLARPLVNCLVRFSEVQVAFDRVYEGGTLLTEAIVAARKLYAQSPGHIANASVFTDAFASYLRHYSSNSELQKALGLADKILPEVEEVQRRHAGVTNVDVAFADLLRTRAGLLSQAGKFEAMLADAERSVNLDTTWQRNKSRMLRAYATAKLGRTTAAAEEIAELARGTPRPDPFQVAAVYSIIAECVAIDMTLPKAEKHTRKTEYLDRAIAAVQEAMQMKTLSDKSRWQALAEHADFSALRERPEVKALIQKKHLSK